MLLLFVPAMAEEDGNLLYNGGFELLDGDGLPSGWYADGWVYDSGVTEYTVTDSAHTGNVAVVVNNLQGNDARFAQNVKVDPDSTYRLSGWICADQIVDSGRGANISVGGVYVFSDSVFDSQGEWGYVEMYGRTGPEQKTLTVFARVGGYSGLSMGRAAFDDLCLEKVDAAPNDIVPAKWYTEPVEEPVYIAGEDDEASPFWPWLLVLAGVYALAAWWMGRWTACDLKGTLRDQPQNDLTRLLLPVSLIVAALVRNVIAAKVTGYQVDVNCFISWGATFLNEGPLNFYKTVSFCDYPPGYLYIMGFNSWLYNLLGGAMPAAFAHKLIPMTCDLLAAVVVYRIADQEGLAKKQSALLAMLMAFNPAAIINSAAWCQVDSVLCLLLMLVAYLAICEKWSLVLPVYVVAILVKPQALMMGFLGLAAIVMVLLKELPHREKDRLVFPRVWKQMGWGLIWSLLAALVILLPFVIGMGGLGWLFELYGSTMASYPYATVNTANLYYLFGANWQSILYPAGVGVTLIFLFMAAGWCVATFMRRKDRALTLLEPAIVALLVLGLALTALGAMPMLGGESEPYIISIGNPWVVYNTADGYVREYISGVEGAWAMQISPVAPLLTGLVMLGAAAALCVMLRRQRKDIHLGLIEPTLMLLFTIVFAAMLVFDATWGALGTVAMAMAFAVVLPMFIRSGKLKMLPLCGAVLFILLYVFGVKMHERYLFPALFLLGMACMLQRDRRLPWLLAAFTCTVFINEGIVLDNAIRLGSEYGHLNSDTHLLACLLGVVHTAAALWSVWLCQRLCAEDAAPQLYAEPLVSEPQQRITPVKSVCSPLDRQDTHRVKWGWLDALLIGVVTAIYAVVTFTTLGSTKAPQTAFSLNEEQSYVVIDLGENYDDFTFLYNAQVSYRDFTVETSDDGVTWTEDRLYWAQMAQGECFRWKYLTPSYMNGTKRAFYGADDLTDVTHLNGRYVRITAQRQYEYDEEYYPIYLQGQEPLILNEVLLRDASGNAIAATIVEVSDPAPENAANLLDEPDTLEGEPGWWNSTYFDEIYHARTAFEHANGLDAYEYTHPPLGKVIMSWFISLFGMTPFGWRFGGALCGVLMLPAMYTLAKQLTKKSSMGFAAMLLMAVDCMHFTQTRIATIDSYPVLFIILSYFFMLRFMQRDIVAVPIKKLLPDLALSGFFMGCGVASKWIGIYAGVGLGVLYFWRCLRALRVGRDAQRMLESDTALAPDQQAMLHIRGDGAFRRVVHLCLWCLLFFVAVPLMIYLGSYVVHYQAREVNDIFDWLKLVWNTQINMLNYHATPGLGMDHPYYSPWYEWFTMQSPMYYASPSFVPEGWRYAIYCFGNPIVWYAGLACVVWAVYRWIRSHRYAIDGGPDGWHLLANTWDMSVAFVLIGFAAQILPWVLVPRGTYIYHYFASVPFLILATVLVLNAIIRRNRWVGYSLMTALLLLATALFIVLFPYASGVLSPEGWMDFIRNYPWTGEYLRYNSDAFVEALTRLLEAIPLIPNVW